MKTLMALLAVLSSPAVAQTAVGNGGHGVRCTSGTTVRHESLDLFEARAAALPIDLGNPSLSVDEKLDLALNRLRRFDEAAYEKFVPKVHSFMSYTLSLPEAPVTSDEGPVNLPASCQLIQVVAQYEPRFPGDLAYVLDRNHWAALDNDSKAALILHETIYHDAIEHGATNSAGVRRLVGHLISSLFATIDLDRYLDLARAADMVGDKVFDAQGGKYLLAVDEHRLYFTDEDFGWNLFSVDLASRRTSRVADQAILYGVELARDRIFVLNHYDYPQTEVRSYATDGSGLIDRIAIGEGGLSLAVHQGYVYLLKQAGHAGGIEVWRFTEALQDGQVLAVLPSLYLRGFEASDAGLIIASDSGGESRVDILELDGTNFRTLVTLDGPVGGLQVVGNFGFVAVMRDRDSDPYRIDLTSGATTLLDIGWYRYPVQFHGGRSYVLKYSDAASGYELWSANLDDTQRRLIGKLRCAAPGAYVVARQTVFYNCNDDESLRAFHKSVF